MTVYRIRNWESFEKADSRKCRRMLWVPLPVNFASLRYLKLMKKDCRHYLAWVVILQTAANCEPRGTLVDDAGRPLTAEDLALKTAVPAAIFEKAIPQLIEIQWLEAISGQHPDSSGQHPALSGLQDKTLQDNTGQDTPVGGSECPEIVSEADVQTAWNELGKPFPRVAVWTSKRKAACRVRLADEFFRENWRNALGKLKASPFLRGEGNRGWRADIDFFLKSDTVTKIMEGKYDDKAGGGGGYDFERDGRDGNDPEIAELLASDQGPSE